MLHGFLLCTLLYVKLCKRLQIKNPSFKGVDFKLELNLLLKVVTNLHGNKLKCTYLLFELIQVN